MPMRSRNETGPCNSLEGSRNERLSIVIRFIIAAVASAAMCTRPHLRSTTPGAEPFGDECLLTVSTLSRYWALQVPEISAARPPTSFEAPAQTFP